MTVDDDFWKDAPIPTIGRRIKVYFLRLVLLPILIISIIYEIIDLKISFGKFNAIGVEEEDLNKFRKRHHFSRALTYLYSNECLYGY